MMHQALYHTDPQKLSLLMVSRQSCYFVRYCGMLG